MQGAAWADPVINALSVLPGVHRAEAVPASEPNAVAIELSAPKGHDLRPVIFETVVKNGWKLIATGCCSRVIVRITGSQWWSK